MNSKRRNYGRIVLVPCLVAAAALVSFIWYSQNNSNAPQHADSNQPWSVLLIVLDTLRIDHLGVWGCNEAISPNIDWFSRDSLVFREAISTAPFTLPAMTAVMTGYYADRAGIVSMEPYDILNCPMPTMAEIMRDSGYATAAVIGHEFLALPSCKINRGFETFITPDMLNYDGDNLKKSVKITGKAMELMHSFKGRPFFLWLQYMNTHLEYQAPFEMTRYFGNEHLSSLLFKTLQQFRQATLEPDFNPEPYANDIKTTQQLYKAAVRGIDKVVGQLLFDLRNERLLENMIVIIMADHAESLGDHGLYFSHDFSLYSELIHVPLIIHIPDTKPALIEHIVSTIDILPTLRKLLPLKCNYEMDGKALPLSAHQTKERSTVFSASSPWREQKSTWNPHIYLKGVEGRWTMAQNERYKLIKIPKPFGPELLCYDLQEDPGELCALPDSSPCESLWVELQDWESEMYWSRPKRTLHGPVYGNDLPEAMKKLGYW